MRHLHQLRLLPAFARAAQLLLGGVGYLVPLAQKRERGRVRLGELAALGELVLLRGLERVRFDARGLGYRHVSSRIGNKKAAPRDGCNRRMASRMPSCQTFCASLSRATPTVDVAAVECLGIPLKQNA